MIDQQANQLIEAVNNPKYALILLALTAWSLVWKGIALWKSAQAAQRNWFIAILIINTFGILELVYIFYFCRQKTENNAQNP